MADDERLREDHVPSPRVGLIMGSDSDWPVMLAPASESVWLMEARTPRTLWWR